MLSLERIKKLVGQPEMSDEEADEFRRAVYELAGITVDLWELEQRGEWRYNPDTSIDMPDGRSHEQRPPAPHS